jgi:hypothetical protein
LQSSPLKPLAQVHAQVPVVPIAVAPFWQSIVPGSPLLLAAQLSGVHDVKAFVPALEKPGAHCSHMLSIVLSFSSKYLFGAHTMVLGIQGAEMPVPDW